MLVYERSTCAHHGHVTMEEQKDGMARSSRAPPH
jgi:hypothetical protein